MLSAALFTIFRTQQRLPLRFQGPLLIDTNETSDFLDAECLAIDLFNMICAPVTISIFLYTQNFSHLPFGLP